ncbi:MAG: ABC transporter ATP-binding protein [Phycisphaerales bacterium]|jgi:ABC-type multidrug transport system fused ATPase/permease subunit|nr:ABC transporter ATP-binding protein [Phycisphaerales bacterium]
MTSFWALARGMLRYRALTALALVMAAISALGLGAGLVGLKPVVSNILGHGQNLPDLVREIDASSLVAGRIPDAWIDALPTGQFTAVVVLVCALGVLTMLGGAANFLHQYLALTVVFRTVTNLRRRAFHHVVRMPLKSVVTDGPSHAISRIVMDTTAIGAGFQALVSRGVAEVTKGAAALIAAIFIDWRLTLAVLPVAFVLYHVLRKLGKTIRRASRGALAHQAELYAVATEALQGLRVVKVHTTERYEAGRFHRMNKDAMKQLMRVRTARALASPLIEMLAIFVLGGLSLVAAKAIIDGELEPSAFITSLLALGAAGASLKPLTGIIADIQQAAGAADRVAELLAGELEPGHDARLPRLPRHRESIAFEHVTLTYPNALRPALRDVSLTIRHGSRVAVVGPNGSGKTTLLALVPRLYEPDAPKPGEPRGVVRIDGRDIAECNIRSLRAQIGVVTQETVLFKASVRENIAYGAEGATLEKIVAAAKKARAHEFIERLPQGYDTVLAEQGQSLSGGQRQRIAIARAILRDPAILILDEATSMIDADSEAKIASAVNDFAQGRTCLIVAHRLSTVVSADMIVVMDEGRIVDKGTHDELIERCDVYRTIASRQLLGGMPGEQSRPSAADASDQDAPRATSARSSASV